MATSVLAITSRRACSILLHTTTESMLPDYMALLHTEFMLQPMHYHMER